VNEIKENTHDALSYHYIEMARLANSCDSYIKEVFQDVKLLGAVGGIFTWQPIFNFLNSGKSASCTTSSDIKPLFLGFVAIIFILFIIGIMNLQKQLIIKFQLEQVIYFESEIRSLLGHTDSPSFRVAEN
jgi:hypothetical protein